MAAQYKHAIEEAKKRLASPNLIPTREGYQGAARLKVKTAEEMAAERKAASEVPTM